MYCHLEFTEQSRFSTSAKADFQSWCWGEDMPKTGSRMCLFRRTAAWWVAMQRQLSSLQMDSADTHQVAVELLNCRAFNKEVVIFIRMVWDAWISGVASCIAVRRHLMNLKPFFEKHRRQIWLPVLLQTHFALAAFYFVLYIHVHYRIQTDRTESRTRIRS